MCPEVTIAMETSDAGGGGGGASFAPSGGGGGGGGGINGSGGPASNRLGTSGNGADLLPRPSTSSVFLGGGNSSCGSGLNQGAGGGGGGNGAAPPLVGGSTSALPGGLSAHSLGAGPQGNGSSAHQKRFDEDVNLSLVKVVVLGATGVGKTSLVKVRTGFHFELTEPRCVQE